MIMKESTQGDATKVTGYHFLSSLSQEQVRLSFEESRVHNTDLRDILSDSLLRPNDPLRGCLDVNEYTVSVGRRAAKCQDQECQRNGIMVAGGHLRLGFIVSFAEGGKAELYKHW
jgi:hypothetical protein